MSLNAQIVKFRKYNHLLKCCFNTWDKNKTHFSFKVMKLHIPSNFGTFIFLNVTKTHKGGEEEMFTSGTKESIFREPS